MFTGIITDIGTIELVEKRGDTRFTISTNYDADQIPLGASIACSGVCLTVVEKGMAAGGGETPNSRKRGWFSVDVSEETLSRTLIGNWQRGQHINLERSLKHGDEMGGHIVTGHIDGLADVVSITPIGDSHKIMFALPKNYAPFVAEKGSVTINGVSLTVNETKGVEFAVNVIPHTWEFTTFKELMPKAKVHFEIDVLARYAAKLIKSGYAKRLLRETL